MSDEIAKCAWCGKEPAVSEYGKGPEFADCDNPKCLNYSLNVYKINDWNETQARILAARKVDFEAGILRSTVFKLGHGELLPSELLERIWNDYIKEGA